MPADGAAVAGVPRPFQAAGQLPHTVSHVTVLGWAVLCCAAPCCVVLCGVVLLNYLPSDSACMTHFLNY